MSQGHPSNVLLEKGMSVYQLNPPFLTPVWVLTWGSGTAETALQTSWKGKSAVSLSLSVIRVCKCKKAHLKPRASIHQKMIMSTGLTLITWPQRANPLADRGRMPSSYKQLLFAVTAARAISVHCQVTANVQCTIAEMLSWLHLKSRFPDISYGIKLQLSRNVFCKDLLLFCYCLLYKSSMKFRYHDVELWKRNCFLCWNPAFMHAAFASQLFGTGNAYSLQVTLVLMFECWPLYRGTHIHLGFTHGKAHDPFLILGWNDWFWL